MAQELKLAVLGAGSWTCVNHLPQLEERPEVKFVAAVDTLEDRRNHVAERFDFELVTDDVDAALATDPDIVIVGATPNAHYELGKAALEAGAHLLSEKPFCARAEDAWELVELARSRQRELVVAFGWNYQGVAAQARDLLAEHGIGQIEHMQIHMATALREMYQATMSVWGRPPEFEPVPSSYTSLARGAGYAQAQLSHALGLALWLFPLRGEQVFALMNMPGAEVDLYDAISLKLSGDCTVALSGACHPLGARGNRHQLELRCFGSDGQLLMDLDRDWLWLYKDEQRDITVDLPPDAGAYTGRGPADAIVDLALGKPGAENRSSGEIAARATEIVQAAYASAQSGRLVDIPLPAGSDPTGAHG
jgi:predicted dehydrogenase